MGLFKKSFPSEQDLLAGVLQKLWLRQLYEESEGYKVRGNLDAVGPRTKREYEILVGYCSQKRLKLPKIEPIFWNSEFVQQYFPVSVEAKPRFLSSIAEDEFRKMVEKGKAVQKRQGGKPGEGLENYLTTVAFSMIEYNLPLPG